MADETPSFPPDESSLSGDVPPPARKSLFHNKQGLRAGWRLAIYVLLVMCIFWPVSIGLNRFANLPKNSAARYLVTFLAEALLFAVVFLAAWIMSRIEHRSAGEYGLPLNANFGKRL